MILFPCYLIALAFSLVFGIQLIKGISVIKFINYGYKKIIENWFIQNFKIDFKKAPEILAGIESLDKDYDNFKLSSYFHEIFNIPRERTKLISFLYWIFSAMFNVIFGVTTLVFTIFYRLSLKSTFWFYLPLLFLVKSPGKVGSSNEIGVFLSKLFDNYVAKTRFLLAAFVIVAFLLTSLNGLKADDENTPFWFIISSMYVYFSDVELWKILQVLVSFVTIILFFWSNYEWKPKASNNIPFEFKGSVWFIYYLNRTRNLLSFFYFLFAIIFISFYFQVWNYKYMPAWVQGFLNWSVKIVTYSFV